MISINIEDILASVIRMTVHFVLFLAVLRLWGYKIVEIETKNKKDDGE